MIVDNIIYKQDWSNHYFVSIVSYTQCQNKIIEKRSGYESDTFLSDDRVLDLFFMIN